MKSLCCPAHLFPNTRRMFDLNSYAANTNTKKGDLLWHLCTDKFWIFRTYLFAKCAISYRPQ